MIIASSVTKKFGKLTALDNVSVTCNKENDLADRAKMVRAKNHLRQKPAGMVVPDSGFITFNQQNITHNWQYRKAIGYMPQTGRYPENMTIAQVLDMMKDIRKQTA